MLKHTTALLAAAILSCNVLAGQWSTGLGVMVMEQPYQGVDTDVLPLPLLNYNSDNLVFASGNLWVNLAESESWSVGLIGEPDFISYKAGDSKALAGMKERKFSYRGGVNLTTWGSYGVLSLDLSQDLLDEHDGHLVELTYSLPLALTDKIALEPHLSYTRLSDDYADYYFGVAADEARVARPAYQAESSDILAAGISGSYQLSKHWQLTAMVEYQRLGDEIKDSPIIDKQGLLSGMLVTEYKF